jgi:redox-sensitive bicupin YhaK (pirin superfamily)
MISIIKSDQRYHSEMDWLSTYWHFSFSDYYDPKNMHWSALRVFNDDVVAGGGGFPMHPHRDMEIVTYVIDGELEHRDHLGHRGVVRPGEVQVMSAGKGIMHSEFNHSQETPVHLLQLWILPRDKNLTPRWEQKQFTHDERRGRLLPVVTDVKGNGSAPGTLKIDQDATIYVSDLDAGQQVVHESAPGRHGYLFVIDGKVTVNGQELGTGDQARIKDEAKLAIKAEQDAHLMLLDLP